jgi:glyceraldehyde 3-phosphate dehydrogenase
MINVAINGFGRIGRNFLRVVLQDQDALKKIKVVAINIGPAKLNFVAHMFKYDSILGTYSGNVQLQNDELIIDNHRIKIFTQLDPSLVPWKQFAVDWVVEASGYFTEREGASKHLHAGARAVLITAPAHDEDVTIIPGVNDEAFDQKKHAIVSLGSCTTNAYTPTLKILHENFIIQQSCMTTVHAYTNSQVLLDVETSDLRRSRAAALNIIPTSTGAMKVATKVMPELAGRLDAVALRVPVAKVSLIDLVFQTEKKLSVEKINDVFEKAERGSMHGIVGFTMEPLVSSDFSGDPHSVVIDGLATRVCGQTMGKIFGWYDNEWGYSARLKDFLVRLG